jgi:hypothetical protein
MDMPKLEDRSVAIVELSLAQTSPVHAALDFRDGVWDKVA